MDAHSKHHPTGGATVHCDNARIESLISQYKISNDTATLSEIVALAQDRARTLIRFRKTTRYCAEDELLSDVNFKLLRAVGRFDPAKGTAFTFVSQVITNALCTAVSNPRSTRGNGARFRKNQPALES